MGGVRIGGQAALPAGLIPLVITSLDDIGSGLQSLFAVWGLSSNPGQDPTRYSALVDGINGYDVMDPTAAPNNLKFMFSTTGLAGGGSEIRYISWLIPDNTDEGDLLDSNPSTLATSMHTHWSPADNDLVVYRTVDNSPNECEIRTVVPSTGVTDSLITKTRTPDVIFPRFNFDGSRIAYGYGDDLRVMNADGSGDTQIVANIGANLQGGLDYAWSPVADELAYSRLSGGVMTINLINGDGTGDTVLYTDPSTGFWGLTLYPWSSDGSTLFYFQRDEAVAPRFSLWEIDAAGGGGAQVSPQHRSYGSNTDYLAYVFFDRVYWFTDQFTDDGDLVSVALDGSDLRTEATFDGDLGSPTELGDFSPGFYYRLNQAV